MKLIVSGSCDNCGFHILLKKIPGMCEEIDSQRRMLGRRSKNKTEGQVSR